MFRKVKRISIFLPFFLFVCFVSYAQPLRTEFLPNGNLIILQMGGPRKFVDSTITCFGDSESICIEFLVSSKNTDELIKKGSRLHIWYSWESRINNGFTNVLLVNDWIPSTGIDPVFVLDKFSEKINNYFFFQCTPIYLKKNDN